MAITPTATVSPSLPWVQRINITQTVAATPTITANSAYVSGNQLGGIMEFPGVIRQTGVIGYGASELVAVTILDSDKQDAAIDLWLFNKSPTITSADHAAFAMSAANMKDQCIGVVQLGASGTYSDAAAVSVCSTVNLNKPVQVLYSVPKPTSIFAVAVVRGTPTYTTTTSLQFQLDFFID